MGEKLVLIDGHSILNRAFFGIPDLTNSEGLHTNAVYGFLNIMFKILEEEQPDYLTPQNVRRIQRHEKTDGTGTAGTGSAHERDVKSDGSYHDRKRWL